MELIDLTKNLQYKKQVKKLYKKAFPFYERMPFFMLLNKAKKGRGDFFAAVNGGEFAALAYAAEYNGVVYLYFLAVEKDMRGRGTGSAILQKLKEIYFGKRIILNIEELDPSAKNYDERVSRKGFYERNGFTLAGVKSRELFTVYDMMVCGGKVTYADYAAVIKNFSGKFIYKLIFREVKGQIFFA